jgi:cell division septation protein DedD
MRPLVFLLILANLFFFAWTEGYFSTSAEPDTLRIQQQLLADQINIVARDEPTAGSLKAEKIDKVAEKKPEKQEKPEKPAEACLHLSELPVADMLKAEHLVAEKFAAFKSERSMHNGSGSFWVFIPPLSGKAEAEKKAGELKALRVPEFFIVQEAGANRFAISLGIFSSKEAANERLAELRDKGVRSARVGERDIKPASGVLELRGPELQAEGLKQALLESVAKTKITACKGKVASAQ